MLPMVAKEIIELQRTRPFPGLRFYVSDAKSYEIRHPEMMMVTRTMLYLAVSPGKDGVPERSAYCDPVHITRIEPMNGRRRRARREKS